MNVAWGPDRSSPTSCTTDPRCRPFVKEGGKMKTLTKISFIALLALVAPAPAQEHRSPPEMEAMIFKLQQENRTLRAECDALSTQSKDAIRRCDQLQDDLAAQRDQQREMVKQYIAERDKAVAGMKQLRASFEAQQTKLMERQDAIAKSHAELQKNTVTLENEKAAAYRFASCSYQFVKGALTALDPAMRRWAAEKLHLLGPDMKPASGLLVEALKDRDLQVQKAARAALKKIDPELAAKTGVE